jgi:hypothetical protein
MPYKVIVDHPELGEQSILIHGLGTFANNTTTEVSDEDVDRFRAANAVVNHTQDPETGQLDFKPELGPHPVDLEIHGVKIEKIEEAKAKPAAKTEGSKLCLMELARVAL